MCKGCTLYHWRTDNPNLDNQVMEKANSWCAWLKKVEGEYTLEKNTGQFQFGVSGYNSETGEATYPDLVRWNEDSNEFWLLAKLCNADKRIKELEDQLKAKNDTIS